MMTLNLALRNLLRNRRRSLATVLAMAIGCTSILLFGGFSANINYMMHTHHVQGGGHLQIQHRDFYLYGSGNPTAYGINDYTKIVTAIQNDDVLRNMVLVASPTLQFGGIAGNYAASVSRTIIGNGFVAEDINRMRLWNDFNLQTKSPVFALEGAPADAAIVGTGVARVLQLCDALKISRCPKPEKEHKTGGANVPDDIAHVSVAEPRPAIESRELASVVRVQESFVLGDELHSRLGRGLRMREHRVARNGFAAPGGDEVAVESCAFGSKRLAFGEASLIHKDDGSEFGPAYPRVASQNPADRFAEKCWLVELGRELYKTNALHSRIVCHHSDVIGVDSCLAWLSTILTPC